MNDDLFDLLGATERAKRLKLLKRQDAYLRSMEALPDELKAIAGQIHIGEVEVKLDQVVVLLNQVIHLITQIQPVNPNAALEREVLDKMKARLDLQNYTDL